MSHFSVRSEGGTRIVALARPPYNALSPEMLEEGAALLSAIANDPPAGGVVVTGSDGNFTRGVDTAIAGSADRAGIDRLIAAVNGFAAALHRVPCALVAAVDGHAIGAGGIMILACDWTVLARRDYRIGLPEAKAGLPFPAVPQIILDHALEPTWRRRLALSSMLLGPEEAIGAGLGDELAEPDALLATAVKRAAEMNAQPGFAACKRQLRQPANDAIDAVMGTH